MQLCKYARSDAGWVGLNCSLFWPTPHICYFSSWFWCNIFVEWLCPFLWHSLGYTDIFNMQQIYVSSPPPGVMAAFHTLIWKQLNLILSLTFPTSPPLVDNIQYIYVSSPSLVLWQLTKTAAAQISAAVKTCVVAVVHHPSKTRPHVFRSISTTDMFKFWIIVKFECRIRQNCF